MRKALRSPPGRSPARVAGDPFCLRHGEGAGTATAFLRSRPSSCPASIVRVTSAKLLVPPRRHAPCFPCAHYLPYAQDALLRSESGTLSGHPPGGIFDIRWSSALGPAARFGPLQFAARESIPLRLRRASTKILAALRAIDRFPRPRPGRPLAVPCPRCHLPRNPSVLLPSPGAPIVLSLRSFTGELPPAAQAGRLPRPSRPA